MPFYTTITTTTTTTTTAAIAIATLSLKRTSSAVPVVPPIQFQKKQKMSLTQTYFLAHTARAKLSREAKRGDHNLRRLVGHANLLDGLMIDLIESEKSQEALFNASVKSQSSHIEWAKTPPSSHQPTIMEDFEEEEDEEDSDSESEDEEGSSFQSINRQPIITTTELSQDDDDDDNDQAIDDEEDYYEHLALTRSPSHSSPPELLLESDDDSDEEPQPPSPPAPSMSLSFPPVSGGQNKVTESIPNAFYEEGFYVPQRSPVVVY